MVVSQQYYICICCDNVLTPSVFFVTVLFGIFSSDGVYVVKDTMESIILACDGGNIPQAVTECFSQVKTR